MHLSTRDLDIVDPRPRHCRPETSTSSTRDLDKKDYGQELALV
jgi:hypothetical protein